MRRNDCSKVHLCETLSKERIREMICGMKLEERVTGSIYRSMQPERRQRVEMAMMTPV